VNPTPPPTPRRARRSRLIQHGPRFGEMVGAAIGMAAMLAVIYAAILQQSEQALGALMAVVAAAVGYFLRGRVERPPTGGG
jgi:hypothetical protein